MKKSRKSISKNVNIDTDVDVDIYLDMDDIKQYIDQCSDEEQEEIINHINGSNGNPKESLADVYRMGKFA